MNFSSRSKENDTYETEDFCLRRRNNVNGNRDRGIRRTMLLAADCIVCVFEGGEEEVGRPAGEILGGSLRYEEYGGVDIGKGAC